MTINPEPVVVAWLAFLMGCFGAGIVLSAISFIGWLGLAGTDTVTCAG